MILTWWAAASGATFCQRAYCNNCQNPYLPNPKMRRCMRVVGHSSGCQLESDGSTALLYRAVHCVVCLQISALCSRWLA